jgi:hypothetical protein
MTNKEASKVCQNVPASGSLRLPRASALLPCQHIVGNISVCCLCPAADVKSTISSLLSVKLTSQGAEPAKLPERHSLGAAEQQQQPHCSLDGVAARPASSLLQRIETHGYCWHQQQLALEHQLLIVQAAPRQGWHWQLH